MYNYIIVVSSAVICICSGILISRKMKSKKLALSAVPISDMEEIQVIKKAYERKVDEAGLESSAENLNSDESTREDAVIVEESQMIVKKLEDAVIQDAKEEQTLQEKEHRELQQMKAEINVLKDIFKKESEYFINKIETLEKEKIELKEALFKEVSLREEAPSLENEKDNHETTEQSTRGLHESNQRLLERIQNQKQSIRHMKDQIKKIKSESYEIQNEDRYKIEDLEEKLSDVICAKEQMETEYDNIEKLTTYNLKLRMKKAAYARALNAQRGLLESYEHNNKTRELQMKSIISELKVENQNLVGKVKESVASVGNLKEQIAAIKETTQQRMKLLVQNLNAVSVSSEEMQGLKGENEQLTRVLKNAEIQIAALTEEREQLLSDISRNEFNYGKLKEFNAHVLEKEKMLQYELTKSRAKSIGLEKICEDFRDQIEKSAKPTQRSNRMGRINVA